MYLFTWRVFIPLVSGITKIHLKWQPHWPLATSPQPTLPSWPWFMINPHMSRPRASGGLRWPCTNQNCPEMAAAYGSGLLLGAKLRASQKRSGTGFQSEADSAISGLSSQLCSQPSQVDSVAHLLWKSPSEKGFRRSEEGLKESGEWNSLWLAKSETVFPSFPGKHPQKLGKIENTLQH